MSSYATEGQQTRAYSAYYGLWIGICWTMSFALTVYGLTHPLAANVGTLVGIASLPLAVWLLRGFRDHVAGELPLRRAWHMAWMSMLGAALITSLAQYIYFAHIDGGAMLRAYTDILAQPQAQELLRQLLPGQDTDALTAEALEALATTSAVQLTFQFLFWNVLLATVCSLPVALAAKSPLRKAADKP
ncbi:MAG: DUF4199 domain-containing protein [Bacteroidaceae bacterium]|nr:DUF4199 domain-containing protein [Bacteroidaceae bacterium]